MSDGAAKPIGCARRVPARPLSGWVQSIWYAAETLTTPVRQRLLPNGYLELVIELGSDRVLTVDAGGLCSVDPVSVIGARVQPMVIEKLGRFETIGVTFKPGASLALLNAAADELSRKPTPLAQLRGSLAHELRERASSQSAPTGKLLEVERVLTNGLLDQRTALQGLAGEAVARLVAAPQLWSLAELSAELGTSRRRLQELFKTEVGVAPKRIQRLWRFRHTLKWIDQAQDVGWGMFALEAGYYDQAHFVNEFREHAGTTPAAYLRADRHFINHLAFDADR